MSFRKVKIAKSALVGVSLAVLVAISGAGLVVSGVPASATEPLPTQCTKKFMDGLADFGQDTPVILVHGFAANSSNTWEDVKYHKDNPTARETINKAKYAKVALNFDYSAGFGNLEWVSNRYTGQWLIAAIGCIDEKSLRNGGPGKVIVVGHSMGGLMARYAYGYATPWGTPTRNYMGKVITLGTPNKGSILMATSLIGGAAGAMLPGSKELKALPVYEKDFPVYAIAGNLVTITKSKTTPWSREKTDLRIHGDDGIVNLDSASGGNWTARYGGGNEEFQCVQRVKKVAGITISKTYKNVFYMPCHHNNLQKSDEGVKLIVTSIERYTTVLRREIEESQQPTPDPMPEPTPTDTPREEPDPVPTGGGVRPMIPS
jgi:hypothetical protein